MPKYVLKMSLMKVCATRRNFLRTVILHNADLSRERAFCFARLPKNGLVKMTKRSTYVSYCASCLWRRSGAWCYP